MTPEARPAWCFQKASLIFQTWWSDRSRLVSIPQHERKDLIQCLADALRAVEQATEQRVWAEAATVTMNFPCVGGATDNVFMTMCNLSKEFRRRAQGGTR